LQLMQTVDESWPECFHNRTHSGREIDIRLNQKGHETMIQLTTLRIRMATVLSLSGLLLLTCFPFSTNLVIGQDSVLELPRRDELRLQDSAQELPAPEEGQADFLTRAPLHEAFAEVPLASPAPNPLIFRQPPEAVEEMPPEYKPEGENIVWISGYWYWDEERADFIWISGVWRETPVGQKWIAGYWHEGHDSASGLMGYRWVNGFWTSAEVETLRYLPQPPAPLELGPSMPAPSEDYFYVPGTWMYQETRYVWRPGYYSAYLEDLVWVPPTYCWTPSGYIFRPGYWDRPIHARGVVFAPVYYHQPIYLQPDYFYRPRFVINTGLGLLPHLFVRRNRCHYYFGDWYGPRYNQVGYLPWANLGNSGYFNHRYDPLFNYYGSPFARQQNLSVALWARQQHHYFADNARFRPPTILNQTFINQQINQQINQNIVINNNFINAGLPQSPVLLAETLENRVRSASQHPLERQQQNFVRINEQQQRDWKTVDRNADKQRRQWERELASNRRGNNALDQALEVRLKTPTLDADPARQARLQQEAAKRTEIQARVQEQQAEATARAQARRSEADQKTLVRNPENQAGAETRPKAVDTRNPARAQQTNPLGNANGNPRDAANRNRELLERGRQLQSRSPADTVPGNERRNEHRRAELEQRLQPGVPGLDRSSRQQLTQQERDLRRQNEDAARQKEDLARQNSAIQRQAERAQREQEKEPREAAEAVRRQAESQQRPWQNQQRLNQQRQIEDSQRRNLQNPVPNAPQGQDLQRQLQDRQRQNSDLLRQLQNQPDPQPQPQNQQRQLQNQQRQLQDRQRQNSDLLRQLQNQPDPQRQLQNQQRQMQDQQRQMEQNQQRQLDIQRRQAEQQQRQLQDAAGRQGKELQRAADRQQRQEGSQSKRPGSGESDQGGRGNRR
jgi:hypothetical protein